MAVYQEGLISTSTAEDDLNGRAQLDHANRRNDPNMVRLRLTIKHKVKKGLLLMT